MSTQWDLNSHHLLSCVNTTAALIKWTMKSNWWTEAEIKQMAIHSSIG